MVEGLGRPGGSDLKRPAEWVVLVANLFDLSSRSDLPIRMPHSVELDRASPQEADYFRYSVAKAYESASRGLEMPRYSDGESSTIYEFNFSRGRPWRADYIDDPNRWNYLVLRYPSELDTEVVTSALRLTDAGLLPLFEVQRSMVSTGPTEPTKFHVNLVIHNHGEVFSPPGWWSRNQRSSEFDLSDAIVADLARKIDLLGDLRALQFPDIWRSISLFVQLDELASGSLLKVLGHFIVWESLLTHRPEKNDPVDSLGRQLRRAIRLVNHRAPNSTDQIDMSAIHEDVTKAVSILYDIRSRIAHGDSFLDVLRAKAPRLLVCQPEEDEYESARELESFLRPITIRVLLAALREPQLISDLRQ